ncbi:alpha/beta hydrolase [Jannaschia donghaensis]|uniref:Thermostable monoacylglycerol lipase n=1 Tax=Jannaschia donghaensis TaxID=420998 RepID=A0A0M6YKB6_9RHOB|nr:alpha/beta fold hydrolase [Jannaschia donghaensis]CTQ50802.1 Thermostable monoacylglycerol lipase [Jannaschia donghaensis]
MRRVFRGLGWLFGIVVVVGAALWTFGPYEPVDTDVSFDASAVPDDIDGWLADRESQVPDVAPEAAKRVVWAGAPGTRTDLVLVYVHGFSATLWETRPLVDRLGADLGANVFYTRLTGHGRDGAAMATATAGDWIEDMAEAMAVALKLGDCVVVIGTSTGGTLAAILAADPDLADLMTDVAGLIFISPNFRVANPAAKLLSLPAARYWAPLVAGESRSFEAVNARHARHWTTRYPTIALLPMQATIDHAAALDFARPDVPALFWYSPQDRVVDASATRAVAETWGGEATIVEVKVPEGDDPYFHVIAGDILSPAGTAAAIQAMADWLRTL